MITELDLFSISKGSKFFLKKIMTDHRHYLHQIPLNLFRDLQKEKKKQAKFVV